MGKFRPRLPYMFDLKYNTFVPNKYIADQVGAKEAGEDAFYYLEYSSTYYGFLSSDLLLWSNLQAKVFSL